MPRKRATGIQEIELVFQADHAGVKAISQVLNRGTITNVPKADAMIDAWKDKIAKLSAEYGEEV